jgi:hypothetical protein
MSRKTWLLIVLIGIAMFMQGLRAEAQPRRTYYVYQVRIKGPAIPGIVGAQPFDRSGYLYLTSTITTRAVAGDVNGLDFFLVSGNPAGSPSPGALYFTTNSLAARNGSLSFRTSMLDLAMTVRVNGRSVMVTPFTTLTRQWLLFTARSGVTASPYMIEGGSINLLFNSSSTAFSGSIALIGRAAWYPSSQPVPYNATITGTYLGSAVY